MVFILKDLHSSFLQYHCAGHTGGCNIYCPVRLHNYPKVGRFSHCQEVWCVSLHNLINLAMLAELMVEQSSLVQVYLCTGMILQSVIITLGRSGLLWRSFSPSFCNNLFYLFLANWKYGVFSDSSSGKLYYTYIFTLSVCMHASSFHVHHCTVSFTIDSPNHLALQLLLIANAESTHNYGIQLSSLDWSRSHCQRYI